MNRKELAQNYFTSGYNCCQAIVLAFKDLLDIDEATLIKISSPFGGGLGRLRGTCGVVSGMGMVIGLLYGSDDTDIEKKTKLYQRVNEIGLQFEKDNGSILCRELLGLSNKHDNPVPDKRTETYYKKRPCVELIGYMAELLEKMIQE